MQTAMGMEIEAKLKVDSLVNVEQRLKQAGGEFVAEQIQKDFYFDDADSSFVSSDKALRLRQQMEAGRQTVFLTYKGPKENDSYKKRIEIEVEVGDLDLTEQLLMTLGYKRAAVVEKQRDLWIVSDCKVALDKVGQLGLFVEIEGPSDSSVSKVQDNLGLENFPHITKAYAELIRELFP
jgi:adenylate cyclase class 2